ncbi:unnamed protein product [Dimorphilus gyrociliatus]|uniref:CRAL-TRIO domain-containing protein n=1 Tax=Dimorphilus gyrociliatus TaxID=2664684 RepID=A0A7I8VPD6_9ANNE|nr:unnamed protein product [Dimorphilus gyrociliatus]
MRYLKARDWNLDLAEKLLRGTVEWRKTYKPSLIDCRWCHEKPGFHSLRQIGFDELGRPVLYCCFAQATVHKYSIEDAVAHCAYTFESAIGSMAPNVHSWVLVLDCSGMTLPACSPKLGYGVTQILANHYPEQLGQVLCVNHNALFEGVWKAIKAFLHPNTASKMRLVRGKRKVKDAFEKFFPPELSEWLNEEVLLNRKKPLIPSQQFFWRKPEVHPHDPRGCPSYVAEYLDCRKENHRIHPNIVDELKGRICQAITIEREEAPYDADSSDDGESEIVGKIPIKDEFQIPSGASQITM